MIVSLPVSNTADHIQKPYFPHFLFPSHIHRQMDYCFHLWIFNKGNNPIFYGVQLGVLTNNIHKIYFFKESARGVLSEFCRHFYAIVGLQKVVEIQSLSSA